MINIIKILFFILGILLVSCSKEEKISLIEEENIEAQMIEAFKEGYKELNEGDSLYAAQKFNEAELLYPQSIWAPRSSLMAAYAYYSQLYFTDAIIELERYLDKYKKHQRRDYAYYLLALCHYDQIVDEKKDLARIADSKKYFNIVIDEFPNSEFAIDSEFKLELIKEILASKEMYIARYYIDRKKWIPAINRLKIVVNDYERTIYVEEALHRLVEINYKIGLLEESKKYAILLGYNYQSSKWYEETYKIFNKDYSKVSKRKKEKKEEKSILKRFKELFE